MFQVKSSIMFAIVMASVIATALGSTPKPGNNKPTNSSAQTTMASTVEWATTKLIDIFSDVLNSTAPGVRARGAKSGFDGAYAMWNPAGAGKFDVLSLIPTLLIVGLGIMLLPVILSCFSQILAPMTYQGRKKREAIFEHPLSQAGMIMDLISTFQKAMDKYNN